MFKKIYYYLYNKYWDWTNEYNKFPGHRVMKDIQWLLQKVFKGYNDRDLWDLDYHLAKLILKRLKAYKQMERSGYPIPVSENSKNIEIKNEDDWEKVLDDMIEGFKAFIVDENCDYEFSIEKYRQLQQKINHGLKLFAKYFGYLWD